MRPTRNRDIIMKKILMALCMTMCLFTINTFAQEVRGVETRYVEDESTRGEKNAEYKDYNVEFTNRNSIPVSVTLELWINADHYDRQDIPERLIESKDIVLEPNESYVWKIRKRRECSWDNNSKTYVPKSTLKGCHIKYKAYKLQ